MNSIQEELVRDGLVEIPAAAAFLGIGRSKLYLVMDNGELPYCVIGRRRLIPKRALVEYAARHLRGGEMANGR